MLKQILGSHGVAQAVALCRPEVICAYPISPQTHIVEGLGALVKSGKLKDCEFINVESEFAAMSVAIGASVAGSRAYTATASQGLLFMAEAIYNAGGLGLPIVMTVASRAIGAPINIWNDHSDSLSQRDSGWIQIFAEDNQEALDMHIQAFKVAEELSVPIMVCMDGFVLTHAVERMDVPDQEQVDKYLPPYEPRQKLDVEHPLSIGAMVGPEAFTEVKYLEHAHVLQALEALDKASKDFERQFGRISGGLLSPYKIEGTDTVVLAMGSVIGTIKDTIDLMESKGEKVGLIGIKSFRPFPDAQLKDLLKDVKKVIVIDRALQPGVGGVVTDDVIRATRGLNLEIYSVIAGLGGRPITVDGLRKVFLKAKAGDLDELYFMDLDKEIVDKQLAREKEDRHTGPVPESVVREVSSKHKGGL
ncbi:MAG: pyruvate ferredoxin oxidoreductase [Burkholderiales bacterium]|nr:pyruvate ferredoxin oxidoreductase [Burkholderiales bacterium]